MGVLAYGVESSDIVSTGFSPSRESDRRYVQLSIREDLLTLLVCQKLVVIDDLRGLDRQMKGKLRQSILESLQARKPKVCAG